MKKSLSVVVPVFNSELSLDELVSRILASLDTEDYENEIILVDDGSRDDSWRKIQSICSDRKEVKALRLSRNFGQHNAIFAGLERASGDWVVVMDADLQDVPEDIPRLLDQALVGFDQVVGRRTSRVDSKFKRITSLWFWKLYRLLTGENVDPGIGNFGIYSREVIQSICAMKEQHKAFGLMALWVGFRRGEIEVEHARRHSGKSEYTLGKMLKLAANGVISHSERLLYFTSALGAVLVVTSTAFGAFLIFSHLGRNESPSGWLSIIAALIFSSGIVISSIGIVALYIGQIFSQTKARPIYLVSEEIR
jgi:glycosyltransferase involved in cell wall biosynthesis